MGELSFELENDEVSRVIWKVSPDQWRSSGNAHSITGAMRELQKMQNSTLFASIEAAQALEEVLRLQKSLEMRPNTDTFLEATKVVASAVVDRFFAVPGAWPLERIHDREYSIAPLCDRFAELDKGDAFVLKGLLHMTCLLLARDEEGALAYQSSVWEKEPSISSECQAAAALGDTFKTWCERLELMVEVSKKERKDITEHFQEFVVNSPALLSGDEDFKTLVIPDWNGTTGPPKLLVSGAGPVGLVAAIHARRNGADVTVLEKRQEFIRIQVIEMHRGGMLGALQKLGGLHFADIDAKATQFRGIARISISNLQRLLSRLAVAVGVRVRFGREVIAYCPPEAASPAVKMMMGGRTRWFAVVYEHPDMTFDLVESSSWETYGRWAAGRERNNSYASFVTWACEQAGTEGPYKAEPFDMAIAAEGMHSPFRAQGAHFDESGLWGEQYTPITFEKYADGGTGLVTLANDALMQNCEEIAYWHWAQAGEESDMYTSSILRLESAEKLREKLKGTGPADLTAWLESPECYLTSKPARVAGGREDGPFRVTYDARNQPSVAMFRMPLSKASRAIVRQVSKGGAAMHLMILGDALTSGYFPMGKGTNFPADLVVSTLSRYLLDLGWKTFLGYYDTEKGQAELAHARLREKQRRQKRSEHEQKRWIQRVFARSDPELPRAEKVLQDVFQGHEVDDIKGSEQMIKFVNDKIMEWVELEARSNGARAQSLATVLVQKDC